MSEAPEQDTLREQPPSRGQVFEHLFPGSSFKDLPSIHPSTSPTLLKYFMWDVGGAGEEFNNAMRVKQGFAIRRNFPHLDQLTVLAYLYGTAPTLENPSRLKGWVNDLLQEGEQLGGLGEEIWSYLPEGRIAEFDRVSLRRTREILTDPRSWYTNIFGKRKGEMQGFFVPVPVRVLGIIGSDGKAVGLVKFVEGPRPDKGERARRTVLIGGLASGKA